MIYFPGNLFKKAIWTVAIWNQWMWLNNKTLVDYRLGSFTDLYPRSRKAETLCMHSFTVRKGLKGDERDGGIQRLYSFFSSFTVSLSAIGDVRNHGFQSLRTVNLLFAFVIDISRWSKGVCFCTTSSHSSYTNAILLTPTNV